MRNFDISIFLNNFFHKNQLNKFWSFKKIWINFRILYGLNNYSINYICDTFGMNKLLLSGKLSISEWEIIYYYLITNINLSLFDLKAQNIKQIKILKNYRGWRHIFNLPTRGQRSHTNARTRKKYAIN